MPLARRLALVIGTLLVAACATAQPAPPDPLDTRELEPFVWHPSFGLTSLGYDSNVFNLPSASHTGTGDWVASLAAGLAPIWNVGDVRLAVDTGLVYNYFRTFASERGVDGTAHGRLDVPIGRVRLHAGGGYANVRQRVNFEIDQRARRTEDYADGGLDIALGGRTTVGLGVRRGVVHFADDDERTQTLRDTLNREERTATASLHYAITPLTAFVVNADRGIHRFDLSPGRNGNSGGLSAGLALDQDAAIAGQATVGWRRITVSNPLVPAFSGLAWTADLSTILGQGTRLGVHGRRDVAFSADELSPYYAQTSVGGAITEALGEGWQIGVRAERVWLDYAHAAIASVPAYREAVNVLGGTCSYRFPGGFRLGLEVESQQRRASTNVPGRAYRTLRTYTVISKSIGG